MHSQKHLLRSAYGFTLAELLVAMAAASLIMALVVATYFGQTTTNSSQGQVVAMQQNLRVALQVMEREIMMAGYKPRPGVAVPAAFGIITADDDELVISMVEPVTDLDRIDNNSDGTVDEPGEKDGRDNDGDGEVDEAGEIITIRYRLYDALGDGDSDLGREELNTGASVSAVAENIEAIEFVYTLADGTQAPTPVPAADLPDIRAIGISILARTEEPSVSGYVDRIIYTPLSGPANNWGAYNDAYRRQLSAVTVNRRNF